MLTLQIMKLLMSFGNVNKLVLMLVITNYMLFSCLKYDTISLLTDNLFGIKIDLADGLDDRISVEKEFIVEHYENKTIAFRVVEPLVHPVSKPDFFYNKVFKSIKLSIHTPPPKIA